MTKQWACITGGATRIGRALALHYAEEGYNLIVHYHTSSAEAATLKEDIEGMGRKCVTIQANFLLNADVEGFIQELTDTTPSLDLLVHNASIFYPAGIDATNEDWERFFCVHVKVPLLITKASAQMLHEAKGQVVTLSDIYAYFPAPLYFPYGVSRMAQISLMKGLSRCYASQFDITSLALTPILPKEGEEDAFIRACKGLGIENPASVEDLLSIIDHVIASQEVHGCVFPVGEIKKEVTQLDKL
jgi:NAD(P)-dependent dehydrogenase (short-subunit alcohol dehydrogenase family)